MQVEIVHLPSFCVIGKEGATTDGSHFVEELWQEANEQFGQISALVMKDEKGRPVGLWGLMSDFSRTYQPWEKDFSEGLYLAGAQCAPDTIPPQGWVLWKAPAGTYLRVENEPGVFQTTLAYMQEHGLTLCGAVFDHTCLQTGKSYMLFPLTRD